MSNTCICCGKKLGVFNGNHLDGKLCDSCYFIFGGLVNGIEETSNVDELNDCYKQAVEKVENSNFSSVGKNFVIEYINSVKDIASKRILQTYKEKELTDEELNDRKELIDNYAELRKKIMLTTGYNFDGYTIEKYYGVFTGNISLGTGFFTELSISYNNSFGTESLLMKDKLDDVRENALELLIKKSLLVGANAIIGISFNLSNLTNNMVIFSATGTAVKIIHDQK